MPQARGICSGGRSACSNQYLAPQGYDAALNPTPATPETKLPIANSDEQIVSSIHSVRAGPGGTNPVVLLHTAGLDLTCPTLVLAGEHDTSAPPATARAIAERIVGAQVEVIARAAHLVPIEAPQAINKLLRTFHAGVEVEG